MSTFLFYNPNSNTSRYSQKERFSNQQSVLNTEHYPKVNRGCDSSVCPTQSSIRNTYDLQPAESAYSTAILESTQGPNQDNRTFSERDISDVASLRSLFLGSDSGAGAGPLEVGELISSLSRRNTQSPSFDDGLAPANEDARITQPNSALDGQESARDTRQALEGVASGPDLATYCLDLSPSPILRANDLVIADDRATGHQSEVILPLRADDPKNFAESAAVWESDQQYTSLNDDETRMDVDKGISIDQCIDRSASEFGPHPRISSPTEISGFGSSHYSNEHNTPAENAHGSIRDPKTCPIALTEQTCLWDLNNTVTSSRQPLVGKESEGSIPNIAEVVSEPVPEPPTILAGACSDAGVQGHASVQPTTPREPSVNPPIAVGDVSIPSDKSAPARSSSRISSYQSCRKTFTEFSHVEIPSRPIAEANRESVAITPLVERGWSCHPSLTNGPWRLDGTTLSIDLRDAEQVPLFVGYSSLRVYDGKLTQSLTFFHGPADGPPVNKSAVKPSPPMSARGPLSLEQKQRLVELKQEGYTWDEILTEFPGRKRSNLQAIYSKSLKDLCSSHPPRYPSLAPRSSSKHLAETVGNGRIKAGRTNKVKKSRYNLRAK
ncbi:hypothetical protein BJX63DRAFT_132810 [Aspergillus granulosus]|uniref:Myb-like domain-containing protein n=1 Tax=Aspergillus granulosus TaxID=176169 RepID=A0ABR4GT03_9EURO